MRMITFIGWKWTVIEPTLSFIFITLLSQGIFCLGLNTFYSFFFPLPDVVFAKEKRTCRILAKNKQEFCKE